LAKWICVLDIGQFSSKIGWGGENEPRYTFYTVTGVPKYTQMAGSVQSKEIYVGNEIMDSIGLYKITFPIQENEIQDWDMFKEILNYVFYMLRVDPTQVHILNIVNPFYSKQTKKKLFSLFLEDYQVRAYYPVRSALLTMYSGGFDTGLVVDMGAQSIRITPIYESYIIDHAVDMLELGGLILDKFMVKKANEMGFDAKTSAKKQLLRLLKELACFVSMDYSKDIENPEKFKQDYSLPDGTTFNVGRERFEVPELFFKPQLFNKEVPPLPQKIIDVVEACDVDIRRDLLTNIFLTGGSSLFPNLAKRLKIEIESQLVKDGKTYQNVRVIAPNQRHMSNWIGGSILSQIPEFQENWVNRKQYFEEGIPEDLM